jgi:predicted ATP-grasp superfamily ATP-dependent carboligase
VYKKPLIIAATSARAYAQAAVTCGYEVIALDAFADRDTQQVTKQSFKLKIHDWQLDAEDFKRVFTQINLDEIDGFLYGSLFDAVPELLAWVAERVPLIGNTPEVMRAAKDFSFFKMLSDLQIAHPEVSLEIPKDPANWLCKRVGGNGGTHIRPASQCNSADYFQREVTGEPISMLFVADGKKAHKIGFNQQFVAPTAELPYRFAGAVSGVNLSVSTEQQFGQAAQQLTTVLGLRGINSLDAILDGETLWMLELNPRLSATFELYPNLFATHLQGCASDLKEFLPQFKSSCAQLILYADEALEIPSNFAWPKWVSDIPAIELKVGDAKIAKNAPICTVCAKAENAESAQELVFQRTKMLTEKILS